MRLNNVSAGLPGIALSMVVALSLLLPALPANAQACGANCSFVLLSPGLGKRIVMNPARAKQPLPPFSSFKIANTLIALELGIVNLEQTHRVDITRYPEQSWWPASWLSGPLNLRDAFQVSALPIFQQIATDVGVANMQQYLDQFDYGNRDISSGIDNFWLNGSLKISAEAQVAFLRKLYRSKLGLKADTMTAMREVMFVRSQGAAHIYAKTGGGLLADGQVLGWYVGYVENASGPHYFALNLQGDDFKTVMAARKPLLMQLLQKHGVFVSDKAY